jgi:hypothetical protein
MFVFLSVKSGIPPEISDSVFGTRDELIEVLLRER